MANGTKEAIGKHIETGITNLKAYKIGNMVTLYSTAYVNITSSGLTLPDELNPVGSAVTTALYYDGDWRVGWLQYENKTLKFYIGAIPSGNSYLQFSMSYCTA